MVTLDTFKFKYTQPATMNIQSLWPGSWFSPLPTLQHQEKLQFTNYI